MKKQCLLSQKNCIPCQGGTPPLDQSESKKLLMELQNDWQINEAGHIFKLYKFKNFTEAMQFANKVAPIAEQEAHHPDLTISWGACQVEIWTHKINGLTESDFILAAKIEEIK